MTAPPPSTPDSEPLLSQHAAVVLLTAAFLGTVVGVLAFLSTGNTAGALLAAVAAAGASVLGLHRLIG